MGRKLSRLLVGGAVVLAMSAATSGIASAKPQDSCAGVKIMGSQGPVAEAVPLAGYDVNTLQKTGHRVCAVVPTLPPAP